ncbi:Putative aliphatic sulfonates transport permease protein ssuC [Delftia tsuruhatensis]|uniref:ABC transporter permease n=1 Tax=Delftia tsuruhatensis TaxID=180282 RepID=UPI001E6BC7AD|nr:ABC transporter permease [Delftia tsuruhatensis]CAB5658795.1 Putative aliphatic sulfonates transport permease protein ssuC [Delftia tsuruhatensis]CAC9679510.1 Putative aliphatic sulfonates transport permease protein ssuC [Delftia tsuruhatensis]
MKHIWIHTRRSWQAIATLAALLVFWEAAVRGLGIREFLLPAPSRIAAQFAAQPGYLLLQSLDTLRTTLLGFALALVLGVAAAIGIVYSRLLDRTLYSLLVALNAVPKVALAPLFVIWMGTGAAPKVAIAMLIAIFPILIDTVLGLRSTDPDMLDMARVNQASRASMLWKIRFPNALPSLFAGMKVGVSFALVGTIVGEFVAGEAGLGHVILVAQGSFDTSTVFVALALLCLLGVALFKAIEAAEARCLRWHASQREKPAPAS